MIWRWVINDRIVISEWIIRFMYTSNLKSWSFVPSPTLQFTFFWSLRESLHLTLLGEKADRARKLQDKMTNNITMAKDRLELLGKRMQGGHEEVLLIQELFWEMSSSVVFVRSHERDVRRARLWKPAWASVWLFNDSSQFYAWSYKAEVLSDVGNKCVDIRAYFVDSAHLNGRLLSIKKRPTSLLLTQP